MVAAINKNENFNDESLPGWDTVVAMGVVYKRVLFNALLVPTILAVTPIALNLAYMIFDRLTSNQTILTFGLTYLSTHLIQNMIRNTAPTSKDAGEALAKTEFWLPLIMFVAMSITATFVLYPLGERLGINNVLTWSPSVTFSSAFGLAVGTVLLELSIILRYVGPMSIVRCSSSPLRANAIMTKVREFLVKLDSKALTELLDKFFAPGDSARRLQYYSARKVFQQGIFSLGFALGFAFVSVHPYFADGDDVYWSLLVISCIIPVLKSLYRTCCSHELNPEWYHPRRLKEGFYIKLWGQSIVKSLSTVAGLVSLFAIIVLWTDKGHKSSILPLLLSCVVTATAVTLYLDVFDDVLRIQLCTPIANIPKVVEDLSDDNGTAIVLAVSMNSILHSQPSLVEALGESTQPLLRGLESKELQRNESAMKEMSKVLRDAPTVGRHESGAELEEDLLRLYVLESLGGTSWNQTSHDGFDKADARHVANIKYWIEPQDQLKSGKVQLEPLSVPVVRALCVYFGGLGEALFVCAGVKVPPIAFPWILAPGTITCAEYALRGSARFILFNFSQSTQASNWKSTHLSMLIPVLIASAFRLEQGILKFTQARTGYKDASLGKYDFVKAGSPELLSLFEECNDAVAAVVQKLLSLPGVDRIDFDLDPDCRHWVDQILARSG